MISEGTLWKKNKLVLTFSHCTSTTPITSVISKSVELFPANKQAVDSAMDTTGRLKVGSDAISRRQRRWHQSHETVPTSNPICTSGHLEFLIYWLQISGFTLLCLDSVILPERLTELGEITCTYLFIINDVKISRCRAVYSKVWKGPKYRSICPYAARLCYPPPHPDSWMSSYPFL